MKAKIWPDDPSMVAIQCPGCATEGIRFHWMRVKDNKKGKKVHDFNGDFEKPTFSPSLNHERTEWVSHDEQKYIHCHSFVRNGMIQFLNDCTHDLRGKTVHLPDIEEEQNDPR